METDSLNVGVKLGKAVSESIGRVSASHWQKFDSLENLNCNVCSGSE